MKGRGSGRGTVTVVSQRAAVLTQAEFHEPINQPHT